MDDFPTSFGGRFPLVGDWATLTYLYAWEMNDLLRWRSLSRWWGDAHLLRCLGDRRCPHLPWYFWYFAQSRWRVIPICLETSLMDDFPISVEASTMEDSPAWMSRKWMTLSSALRIWRFFPSRVWEILICSDALKMDDVSICSEIEAMAIRLYEIIF